MKLSIKNFRNITSEEIEGSRIHIQGKNGAGKSNVLRAIERCLFGTIYGRKQGITPVKSGEEHCQVVFNCSEHEWARDESGKNAYVNSAVRPIIFCNLLDQEYPYIKKVLADILIQDRAKSLFGSYRMGTIDSSITHVKTSYTVANKEFLRIKNRIDFLNEEISRQEHITAENMEVLETQYVEKKQQLNKYTSEDGATLKSLEEGLKSLEDQRQTNEQRLQEYKLNLNRLLMLAEKQVADGLLLKQAKCPTCGSDYKDETLLAKTRDEYKNTTIAVDELRTTITAIEGTLVKINIEITEAEKKKLAVLSSSSESIVSQATLERELNSLYTILADYGSKLQQKITWETELQSLVDKLIVLEKNELYAINDRISPQGELNQLLQAEILKLFPDITFAILEENEYGETKSTMSVYYKDIEYKELSRSEKLYINVLVSVKLMELKPDIKYPLLLDDTEMFSKAHITKLENLLANSSVEYIMTKVCSCPRSISAT